MKSSPKPSREPIWWLPLARRVLRWGALTALLVSIVPLVLAAIYARLYVYPPAPDPSVFSSTSDLDAWVLSVVLAFFQTSPLLLMGAALGGWCGFYAPPSDPPNLLKSRFVRVAAAQTLGLWLGSFVGVGATLTGFDLLLATHRRYFWISPELIPVLAGVGLLLFALCLWRGLNLALRATTTRDDPEPNSAAF